MGMEPKVLFYNLSNSDKASAISEFLEGMGVKALPVERSDYESPLGALVGLPGYERTQASPLMQGFSDEMLVMFNFTEKMLDDFLAFFRKGGAEPVSLKAMVTPTNVNWNSLELHREISEEHRIMSGKK